MKPHKHAALIKAWADGAEIQYFDGFQNDWVDIHDYPAWSNETKYRIKPEPKQDVTMIMFASPFVARAKWNGFDNNLKLTFDGETGALKSAEVMK